jgi:adenylate cyclase
MTGKAGPTCKAERFRIGDLLLDVGQQRVWRGDVEIHLPKLSFDLLVTLVRAAPNLVSNYELMERVWQGIVVSPETVSQRVKLLRSALGDDARKPCQIAACRGRGYRFAADVRALDEPITCVTIPEEVKGAPAPPLQSSAFASIAILPFANLTGDPAQEYFGDGMAEELINTLTRAPGWFKVPARSSSFAYKGRNIDVRTIARDLGVDAVLEGSVRSAGDRIRITAQLIDGRTGHHRWSQSYDRKFEDLFKLQDELTVGIVDALTVGGSSLSIGIRKPPTRDLEAYQLFLQAKSLEPQPTEQHLRIALDLLVRALERDPTFARAWQGMAVVRGYYSVTMGYRMPNALSDAESDAHHALALDPSLWGAHAVLGFIGACRGDWIKAEAEIRTALSLLPNDPEIYLVHAIYVAQSAGQLQRALEEAHVACRLAPLTPVFAFNVGASMLLAGESTEALRWVELAIANGLQKDLGPVPDMLAHLAMRHERYSDAVRYMTNVLSPAWRAAGGVDAIKSVYGALSGSSRDAIAALRKLEERLRDEDLDLITSKRLMMWYTLLGALDFAYESANRALDSFAQSGTVGIAWGILWIPEMREFRRDLRFQAFVTRLGLMEYWQQYGPPDGCELRDGMLICP